MSILMTKQFQKYKVSVHQNTFQFDVIHRLRSKINLDFCEVSYQLIVTCTEKIDQD